MKIYEAYVLYTLEQHQYITERIYRIDYKNYPSITHKFIEIPNKNSVLCKAIIRGYKGEITKFIEEMNNILINENIGFKKEDINKAVFI